MIVSGAILAGGESKRMGRDKKWILFNGKTLLEIALGKLKEITEDVMIVLHGNEQYQSAISLECGSYMTSLMTVPLSLDSIQHSIIAKIEGSSLSLWIFLFSQSHFLRTY